MRSASRTKSGANGYEAVADGEGGEAAPAAANIDLAKMKKELHMITDQVRPATRMLHACARAMCT